MDSLLVDLDKVLDDFEAEEDEAPGNERKPSGFHEFLEKSNEQTFKVIDSYIPASEIQQNDQYPSSQSTNNIQDLRYDFPYEPENFDLSEADFAPSPTLGDSGYNGSLNYSAYSNYDEQKLSKGLVKGTSMENQNGSSNSTERSEVTPQTSSGLTSSSNNVLSKDSTVIKNDLQPGKFKLTYPVQADNSPNSDRTYYSSEVNGYGNYQWTEALMPKQNNSDVNLEQTAVRQVSVQSFTSTDSKSDPDKYPVQCNTPQTPKENMLMNPLDSQISSLSSVQNSSNHEVGALSDSSHDVMQGKGGLDPKLSHLKHDISGNIDKDGVNYDANVFMNASNSLPASFHANLTEQNNRQSSLPLNLSNGMQDLPAGGDKNSEYCNGDIHKHNSTEETKFSEMTYIGQDSENVIEPQRVGKEQMEVTEPETEHCEIVHKSEQPVVGFGAVDDEMDDSHMDDYLRDIEMIDKTVTDEIAYTTNNNDYMDDLGGETVREMTDKANINEINTFNKMTDDDKQRYRPIDSAGDLSIVTNKTDSLKVDMLGGKNEYRHGQVNPVFNQITNPAADVIQVLPVESVPSNISNSKPVISDLGTNLSPSGLVSIDSGLASLTDNVTDSGTFPSPVKEVTMDVGARPKSTNNMLNMPSGLKDSAAANFALKPSVSPTSEEFIRSVDSSKFEEVMHNDLSVPMENEIKQRMDNGDPVSVNTDSLETMDTSVSDSSNTENQDSGSSANNEQVNLEGVELRRPQMAPAGSSSGQTGRPRSWSPSDSGQPPVQKQKRPTSLNLPPLPQINLTERSARDEDSNLEELVGAESGEGGEGMAEGSYPEPQADLDNSSLEGAVGGEEIPYIPPEDQEDFDPPPSYSSTLGIVAPKWIPDAEAPLCMSCDARFTFTKRRHHCRACGKIFCSACCNMKARLVHLKNQEARVCLQCHQELVRNERPQRGPHPNNPGDYCSMVPPQQGASSSPPPPSVLVPVLKRDGNGNGSSREEGNNRRSEPKQVMFSDGIRPGGDLTELDGSSEVTRLPPRRTRVQKRVEKVTSGGQHSSRSRRVRTMAERSAECFIPAEGLPPILVPKPDGIGFDLQKNPDPSSTMTQIKDETSPPVIFAINHNLHLLVKIINLDCCVNRVVWCITTRGMTSVGQEEIVTVLETIPDEVTIQRDLFTHLNAVYEDASKGNPVTELGHTIFNQSFLDSRDHGGFLYIRSTFQCTQKLILPTPPYLFGILLQKWETPWAKVFPIRLLLRLGAEYRYYPCPLIGVRNRKPVFFEIGHTIMNLLADFRNYQYMLPSIKGITIHMEDKVTKINFPKNTYDDLMKVVNNSNEHVMAVAANFSPDADSHLVCIQNDDGNYQTQAINIQNKPRKVTGASFVVFNGALKASSGLTAKSSIVEDGLMVQITPDSMLALKQAMKDMQDYTITCAVIGAPKPDETVMVQWVEDDKNVNIGVKSPIDSMSMDGIESLRIQNSIDYIGERFSIRWTEIFFIQNRDGGSVKWEPVDLSRLGETLATAFCVALTPHLQKLKDADLTKIGLRVTLGADNVGYEAGAGGERLPDVYMNDLDNELIPVIHRATQADGSMILEMIFQILE